jgi:hypothetical protein
MHSTRSAATRGKPDNNLACVITSFVPLSSIIVPKRSRG